MQAEFYGGFRTRPHGPRHYGKMSALGQKQTSRVLIVMSALSLKADIERSHRDVRFVPIADMWLKSNNHSL
jgi:hypothetical protein